MVGLVCKSQVITVRRDLSLRIQVYYSPQDLSSSVQVCVHTRTNLHVQIHLCIRKRVSLKENSWL